VRCAANRVGKPHVAAQLTQESRWRVPGPSAIWLVRHGESVGNVADARAQETGSGRLELDVRDPDVPLSDTGRSQAEALGRYLAALPPNDRPTAVLSSPFARARTTAELAVGGLDVRVRTDERLRERDFGAFDGMTRAGIREHFPDEARRRGLLGKFYYRPPGGESWADVALRIRSLLATESLRHDGERILVVAHQAVIMVFRYVLEELSEEELLAVDREEQVANASVTRYETGADGELELRAFNGVEHLVEEAENVTEEPRVPQQT
jgi:broad specificity phosphatase PhoE